MVVLVMLLTKKKNMCRKWGQKVSFKINYSMQKKDTNEAYLKIPATYPSSHHFTTPTYWVGGVQY